MTDFFDLAEIKDEAKYIKLPTNLQTININDEKLNPNLIFILKEVINDNFQMINQENLTQIIHFSFALLTKMGISMSEKYKVIRFFILSSLMSDENLNLFYNFNFDAVYPERNMRIKSNEIWPSIKALSWEFLCFIGKLEYELICLCCKFINFIKEKRK